MNKVSAYQYAMTHDDTNASLKIPILRSPTVRTACCTRRRAVKVRAVADMILHKHVQENGLLGLEIAAGNS